MISLKDYIIEGIFDDESNIANKVIKTVRKDKLNAVKAWAKAYAEKGKGRIKVELNESGEGIVKYVGKIDHAYINYDNIPDDVKIDFSEAQAPFRIILKNVNDNFMERIVGVDELEQLEIMHAKTNKIGQVNIKNIDSLQYMPNKADQLHDLSAFKDCQLHHLTIWAANHRMGNYNINLDGLDISGILEIRGTWSEGDRCYVSRSQCGFQPTLTGNYKANDVRVDLGATVTGLPSKLNDIFDETGFTVFSGEITQVNTLILQFSPVKETLDFELNRLKSIADGTSKLPKFKKLSIRTPWDTYRCKEKDVKDIIQQIIAKVEEQNIAGKLI